MHEALAQIVRRYLHVDADRAVDADGDGRNAAVVRQADAQRRPAFQARLTAWRCAQRRGGGGGRNPREQRAQQLSAGDSALDALLVIAVVRGVERWWILGGVSNLIWNP
ncbi:hypothetical protein [Burkholderia pseudomallei]|uniref:hypothetical protein n=1 Tax=Burkholderia pseudomallei TaxID=28450 RepID=UPI0039851C22